MEKAIYYYKIAAENGFFEGYNEVGLCYQEMGGEENQEKALKYFYLYEFSKQKGMKEQWDQRSRRIDQHRS